MINTPTEEPRGIDLSQRLRDVAPLPQSRPQGFPIPSLETLISPLADRAPGLLHICSEGLKRGVQYALMGAATAAAVVAAATLVFEPSAIMNFLTNTLPRVPVFQSLSPFSGLLATSAVIGAGAGFALGAPHGCAKGVQHVREYYSDVALPRAASAGIKIGAQLTEQAHALEEAAEQNLADAQRIREAAGGIQHAASGHAKRVLDQRATQAGTEATRL